MTVYVTEYENQPVDAGQGIAVGQEGDGTTIQQVAEGAGNVQSANFAAKTKFIRVHTTANILFRIGTGPTASTGSRMVADTTEFHGVVPGGNDLIAVTTTGA